MAKRTKSGGQAKGRVPDKRPPRKAPEKLRLKTPGWRIGKFTIRCGGVTLDTYRRLRTMLQDAYRTPGYRHILDAVADREISLAEAGELSVEGGLIKVAERVNELRAAAEAKAAAEAAGEEGVVAWDKWLDDFLEVKPRKASEAQHEKIVSHARAFLVWLAERHDCGDWRRVPPELWDSDNLQVFVTKYISGRMEASKGRLEARWAKADDPPGEVEQGEALAKERGKKSVTANRYVNSIGAISDYLMKRGRVASDPAPGNRLTTKDEAEHRQDDHRHMEPADWRVFREASLALDEEQPVVNRATLRPDTLFWDWLIGTGATTYTEGIRLRPADLGEAPNEAGQVPIRLHGSKAAARKRKNPIHPELRTRLLKRAEMLRLGRERLLFPFDDDKGRYWWNKVLARVERDNPTVYKQIRHLTPYCLRHSYAIDLLGGGADIRQVQQLMGHASIHTTEVYLSSRPAPHAALAHAARMRGLAGDAGLDPAEAEAARLLEDAQAAGGSVLSLVAELLRKRAM